MTLTILKRKGIIFIKDAIFSKGSENLKKIITVAIAFLMFVLLGLVIGVQLNSVMKVNEDLPYAYNNDTRIQEIIELRKENDSIRARIEELEKKIGYYEDIRVSDNISLKRLKEDVNQYKLLSGHLPVEGEGIVITIEGTLGGNIAGMVERKRYLLNLVNELKVFGAEVISVNDRRITGRSEISFAGNHIIINSTPIAPPYVVRAIGNVDSFERYVKYRTVLFELMMGDGITADVQFHNKIKIPAVTREKPMEFLRPITQIQ